VHSYLANFYAISLYKNRGGSQVYNSLLSTKKILEQAYKQKFSLSETIQVVNQLSYDQVQKISSKRRELDEMLDGRGKIASKETDRSITKPREVARGSVS